jgi:hypothetical protein
MLELFALATGFASRWGCTDAASGNAAYQAVEASDLKGKADVDYGWCSNHQTMLGHIEMIVSVFGASFLKAMHKTATFLNLSTHRLRMMLTLRDVLFGLIVLRQGTPPAVDVKYAEEVKGYLGRWAEVTAGEASRKRRKMRRRKGASKPNACKWAGGRRKTSIEGFFTELHGGFDLKSPNFYVYIGDEIETVELKTAIVEKVYEHVCNGMLISMVPTPDSAKWLKTGPSSDRLFLLAQGRLLGTLITRGLGRLVYQEQMEVDDVELDRSFAEWHAVAGSYFKATKAYVCDDVTLAKLPSFLICDERNRYLQHKHLHYGYATLSYSPSEPTRMQVYTNPKRSPVYKAACSDSAIMSGSTSRLIMAWRFRGCETMREWFRDYPAEPLRIFRAASGQAAILRARQWGNLKRMEVLSTGDPAMTGAEVSVILQRFACTPKHELSFALLVDIWEAAWSKVDRSKTPKNQLSQCVEIMKGEVTTWAGSNCFCAILSLSVGAPACSKQARWQGVGSGRGPRTHVRCWFEPHALRKRTCGDCGAWSFDGVIHGQHGPPGA